MQYVAIRYHKDHSIDVIGPLNGQSASRAAELAANGKACTWQAIEAANRVEAIIQAASLP